MLVPLACLCLLFGAAMLEPGRAKTLASSSFRERLRKARAKASLTADWLF
jgi:hypothetical protein